jgi:putative ABC transport system substrate-binding protein
MHRRTFVAVNAGALLLLSAAARAQRPRAARRIGWLSAYSRTDVQGGLGQLRTELEKLGWIEGRNIVFLEPRVADGRNELLPAMAGELVAQNPDLIIVGSTPATRALMQATRSIPIVMIAVGNPVELGLVADFRKPGGNVTGSTFLPNDLGRKLLQMLKEAAPRLRSVALFANPTNESAPPYVKRLRADAAALGMHAQVIEVSGQGDFEAAFAAIHSAKTESILLAPEALIRSNYSAISDFAQAHGLPLAVVGSAGFPAAALIAFGPTPFQYWPITARFIDRILKGANPGDLAVEEPTRFGLMINLRTAKALGLTIPQALLQRADELIQ